MNRKVTVSFTEPENAEEQKQTITDAIAGGFYTYLKKHGHLKKDPSLKNKVEQTVAKSRKLCQGIDDDHSA